LRCLIVGKALVGWRDKSVSDIVGSIHGPQKVTTGRFRPIYFN
jgi:hypothetical protein